MDCSNQSIQFLLLLLLLLLLRFSFCNGDPNVRCKEIERKALVKFKEGIKDPGGRLSSWTGEYCCRWRGVGCSNRTGRVVQLNLRNPFQYQDFDEEYTRQRLSGEINPSLLNLKYLNYLDLSMNYFPGIHIPHFLGSFNKLRYLNLSSSYFVGMIPPHLGNLSTLRQLDLSSDTSDFGFSWDSSNLRVGNLHWISRLSSLEYLNLGSINLSNTGDDWFPAINKLSLLQELRLSACELHRFPLIVPFVNLTSLSVLDLSGNYFNSSLPHWLLNISSLVDVDLSSNRLNLSSSLIPLCNLRRLDLSYDYHSFGELGALLDNLSGCNNKSLEALHLWSMDLIGHLPVSIGCFLFLKELNLFDNQISGPIPESLGKLSKLISLDLSLNIISGPIPESIGQLSKLVSLDLSLNKISGSIPESVGQLSKLVSLDLSLNKISGPIPESIGQLSKLVSLDLSSNKISGPIPESIGQLSKLVSLDLFSNQISEPIPESLGQLSKLLSLDLFSNQISGLIPECLGQLEELVSLDLGLNSWDGATSENQFAKLTKLKELRISSSSPNKSLVFDVRPEWIPPFKLDYLGISNCQVGPNFPRWLKTQNLLTELVLNNVGISDTIPEWFWKLFSLHINHLDLSNNRLHGSVPNVVNSLMVDLSNNSSRGPLPLWSANLSTLILRHNLFSGPIPSNIGEKMPLLYKLDLSFNRLNGTTPSSIAKMKNLQTLDLSNNHLSGQLMSFDWKGLKSVEVINLSYNNLSGTIPNSIGFLTSLEILILSNNNLYGELPSSLKYCTSLVSLDLGNNNFSGIFPAWIGENLLSLVILHLRANSFVGKIPQQLCHMTNLQILNLAQNKFSGFIPTCLGNLSGLIYAQPLPGILESYSTSLGNGVEIESYDEHMRMIVKGAERDYNEEILSLMKAVDLSSNNLSGNIPTGITMLSRLVALNLSRNHLTGKIPWNVGNLTSLESLDLSRNQLSGKIPPTISSLNFLSDLNLSYNSLSGRIPSGNQLQTLNEPSIYQGNPELCGPPLSDKCPGDEAVPQPAGFSPGNNDEEDNQSTIEMIWFYIGMAMGFVVGFWVVFGTLLLNKSWRRAYFYFVENIADKIYVVVALNLARFRRYRCDKSNFMANNRQSHTS